MQWGWTGRRRRRWRTGAQPSRCLAKAHFRIDSKILLQAGEDLALAQALAEERAGDTEEVLAIAEQAEAEAAAEAARLSNKLLATSMRAEQVRFVERSDLS